jgi:hypothetical protein
VGAASPIEQEPADRNAHTFSFTGVVGRRVLTSPFKGEVADGVRARGLISTVERKRADRDAFTSPFTGEVGRGATGRGLAFDPI